MVGYMLILYILHEEFQIHQINIFLNLWWQALQWRLLCLCVFTGFFSLLREWIYQVSTESVVALGVSTKLSAWKQLSIDLTATSKLEKNSLSATILWILTVIFPGWGNQLTVLHQLHLLVEPLTCIANFGISREGEEVETSVGGRECTCEESGWGWGLCMVGLLR